MSINRVREYLKKYDLDKKIKEFNASSATVHEASLAIGCKEKDIAKTLSFLVEDNPILIVVRGDVKIDNSTYEKGKTLCIEDNSPLIFGQISKKQKN